MPVMLLADSPEKSNVEINKTIDPPSLGFTKEVEDKKEPDLGYYSGLEFENLERDLEKSICESVDDLEEEYVLGKDHGFQPFDFLTSRKTKRFFREDVMNITRAITNKDYNQREQRKEIDRINPNINRELLHSEIVYDEYLSKYGPV